MDINIFLASSSELKEDRNGFQVFMSQLNEEWNHRDINFKLTIWEDFIDSMSKDGLQAEYNKVVEECDIFLMLLVPLPAKIPYRSLHPTPLIQQRVY